jgi:hypothetical protein
MTSVVNHLSPGGTRHVDVTVVAQLHGGGGDDADDAAVPVSVRTRTFTAAA